MEAHKEFDRAPWELPDGRMIDLITPSEFHTIEVGAVLTSIRGEEVVKGIDYIDQDVRAGFLAFGFERKEAKVKLNVGDRVRHVGTQRVGTIVEVDRATTDPLHEVRFDHDGIVLLSFERNLERADTEMDAWLEAEVEDAMLQAMGVIGRRSRWTRLRAWVTHSS